MAEQGWHLIAVDRNSEEIPLTWRFFWERGERRNLEQSADLT
jgi:hypothetical protein